MRCFIAIELPEEIKAGIRALQEELKKSGADIRWVAPDNIHLTLKFLGEIKTESIPGIEEILGKVCRGNGTFSLEIKGIGVFPGLKSPRVLWLGIENSGLLQTLQSGIEEETEKIGFKREEREFRAHLTLGRFRPAYRTGRPAGGKKDVLEAIKNHENDSFGKISVSALSLMKSDLHPSGARHTCIREFTLKK